MRSFRLHTLSTAEWIQTAVAFGIGIALFVTFGALGVAESLWRTTAILGGAVTVGWLCRGQFYRTLRRRYPHARAVGLLAIGFVILAFWGITQLLASEADTGRFTLAFILPALACISVFVIVNRKDPDVTR